MVVEIDDVPVLSTSVQENGYTAAPVNVAAGQPHRRGRLRQRPLRAGRRVRGPARQAAHLRPQPALRRDRAVRGREHRAGRRRRRPTRLRRRRLRRRRRRTRRRPRRPGPHRLLRRPRLPRLRRPTRRTSSGPATPRSRGTTRCRSKRWPDNNEWVSFSCQDRSRFSQVAGGCGAGQARLPDRGPRRRRLLRRALRARQRQHVGEPPAPPDAVPRGTGGVDRVPDVPAAGLLVRGRRRAGLVPERRRPDHADQAARLVRNAGARDRLESHGVRAAQQRRRALRVRADAVAVEGADGARPLGEVDASHPLQHRSAASGSSRRGTTPTASGCGRSRRRSTSVTGSIGNRIYTHTQKAPTGHPDPACPADDVCSHARIGIYRDQDVSGTSVIYHDGWTVAKTRARRRRQRLRAVGRPAAAPALKPKRPPFRAAASGVLPLWGRGGVGERLGTEPEAFLKISGSSG